MSERVDEMWDRDRRARTDDEIEQLADFSLEAKAFGHFVCSLVLALVLSYRSKEHKTDTKTCARRREWEWASGSGSGKWRVAIGTRAQVQRCGGTESDAFYKSSRSLDQPSDTRKEIKKDARDSSRTFDGQTNTQTKKGF